MVCAYRAGYVVLAGRRGSLQRTALKQLGQFGREEHIKTAFEAPHKAEYR